MRSWLLWSGLLLIRLRLLCGLLIRLWLLRGLLGGLLTKGLRLLLVRLYAAGPLLRVRGRLLDEIS